MARIEWDRAGYKFFETGIDRGVLYPKTGWGIAWRGLTSVSEKPQGGESTPYYRDGIKYYNEQTVSEFAGTISAFTYPDAFGPALGLSTNDLGLHFDGQPRAEFGMCYRTLVGNDIDGIAHGYKLHLVYDALVDPFSKDYGTVASNPDASDFSWDFTTKPLHVSGRRVTSHLIVESKTTDKFLLASLEDMLYGKPGKNPTLPTPQELIDLFETYQPTGYGYGPYGHTEYGHGNEY